MLPDHLPRIEHPPVRLRAFEARDAALVASVADDPLIPLVTTVPTSGSAADARAYLQRQHDRLRAGQGYSFAIADVVTDEAVGQIGLWTAEIAAGRATTGYWVAGAHRRQGYAGAALAALTDWALSLPEVERLQLHVEPWNDGSWRAAERCGYQREGLLRAWERVGSDRRDMYVYSVVPGT
ncbi:GNAT family N-acetyltransferase [Nocardioides nitrophenolicus]|uniref:GNAT family N-acetyltransferase n=1 Tax=Nocardioides nitrophenolicus TaxID=60489 RepID=UPI001958A9EB|nr:GNAT family protein [Nocardioides nitrophenolicus]MBM7516058.1 RimJ/RimL family protein N-acetyltransferase [Nocardioides nitrophenolicus]